MTGLVGQSTSRSGTLSLASNSYPLPPDSYLTLLGSNIINQLHKRPTSPELRLLKYFEKDNDDTDDADDDGEDDDGDAYTYMHYNNYIKFLSFLSCIKNMYFRRFLTIL